MRKNPTRYPNMPMKPFAALPTKLINEVVVSGLLAHWINLFHNWLSPVSGSSEEDESLLGVPNLSSREAMPMLNSVNCFWAFSIISAFLSKSRLSSWDAGIIIAKATSRATIEVTEKTMRIAHVREFLTFLRNRFLVQALADMTKWLQ